jgi:hypothetical protein
MEQQPKTIFGKNEEEIWQQISADFAADDDLLEYSAIINQGGCKIELDIDIDPGGGFESGYEFTKLISEIDKKNDFRFGFHHEGFIDRVGKFFGMEDVIVGFPGLDEKLIIQTNDKKKARAVFKNEDVRNVFESLADFSMHISHHEENGEIKNVFLELEIQKGITNAAELRKIYHAFYAVLSQVNSLAV